MKNYLLIFVVIVGSLNAKSQSHDYAKAQYLSTYFLGGQRCGDTDSWLHGACHLTDGESVGKDLSGGWHDCGDHIKFHVTGGYTALTYLYAYDKFPQTFIDQYSPVLSAPPSNGIPDILDEVKYQTDYLIKCIDGNTIYWEVGGPEDHNSFKEPVSNSLENLYNGSNIRPVRSATEAHSNAFGDAAAALALMSIHYAPFDSDYAESCLNAAQAYYAKGEINQAPTADYTATAYSFMANTETNDNMGMAAVILYRATDDLSYLTAAEHYASGLPSWENFTYYSMHPILFLELYQITGEALYLNNIESLVNAFTLESCGYLHQTNWGSLRDAGGSAFIAALYHQETNNDEAYHFAKSNIDFILGSHEDIADDAPANFSFLVGYNELGGGYPQHPHHAAAFGKTTNDWNLFTKESNNPGSVEFEFELTGGLAGGPESACNEFYDNIGNYISSEYCGYYNAAFTGAVAYINKIEANSSTAIDYDTNSHELQVYPNPSNDLFTVKNSVEINEICVYNYLGDLIIQGYPENQVSNIDLSKYPMGVYFLKANKGQYSTLLIKN